MEFNIPPSLQSEHRELHDELAKGTQEPGQLGEAARNVARVLDPHFAKEEEYALPPLGLLAPLVGEAIKPPMRNVLSMTDRLQEELPEMLREHKNIVVQLEGLVKEARKAGKPEYEHFAAKLTLHAKTEEEVLYPASLLIGEYIKLKLSK